MRIRALLILAAGAATVPAAAINLVANHSFEVPVGFGFHAAIPGWTALVDFIELGDGSIYGISGYDGVQVVELDAAFGNAVIEQIVGTAATTSYNLSFGVAQRAGVDPLSCKVEVWWDGALLDVITPASTVMAYYGYTVSSSGAGTSLQFRGAGAAETLGGLVDDVHVEAQSVPEPFTLALMGGAAVAGYRRVRRRRA